MLKYTSHKVEMQIQGLQSGRLEDLARQLKALSDPTRLSIFDNDRR